MLRIKDMCLKIGCLSKLKNVEGSWKDFIVSQLPGCNLDYLLECNTKVEDLPWNVRKNNFWYDVFQYWCWLNYKSIDHLNRKGDIMNSNIWLNSNIRINKKVIFWTNWFNNGITKLSDIISADGIKFCSLLN